MIVYLISLCPISFNVANIIYLDEYLISINETIPIPSTITPINFQNNLVVLMELKLTRLNNRDPNHLF